MSRIGLDGLSRPVRRMRPSGRKSRIGWKRLMDDGGCQIQSQSENQRSRMCSIRVYRAQGSGGRCLLSGRIRGYLRVSSTQGSDHIRETVRFGQWEVLPGEYV